MSTVARSTVPDAQGHFGPYGGRFVPETLMHPLQELQDEYFRSQQDVEFQRELEYYLREFCGRPTPLYLAERLTRELAAPGFTSSGRTCCTPARTRSTIASGRSCWLGAWARAASLPRRARASMAW